VFNQLVEVLPQPAKRLVESLHVLEEGRRKLGAGRHADENAARRPANWPAS